MEYIIFVGNPGTGKSTLLNSLVGKCAFASGVSYGHGLTSRLQLVTHGKTTYGDTPGLSDINLRKQAAEEIKKALIQCGNYKLVFVVTIEAGRVRPDDVTTMKLVLDSISDGSFPYGIIVNKVTLRIMQDAQDTAKLAPIIAGLNCGHRPTTNVLFLPRNDTLEDGDNVVIAADANLVSFLAKMTPKLIAPEIVHDIAIRDFDKMKEELEKQLTKMKEDVRQQQIELERQREEYRRQIDLVREREEFRRQEEYQQNAANVVAGIAAVGFSILRLYLED